MPTPVTTTETKKQRTSFAVMEKQSPVANKLVQKSLQGIQSFLQWKEKNGYASYDQYDFWSTRYGIWSKAVYYKNKYLGAPFIAPIFLAEIFCPSVRKLFVTKKRFPIADAHFIMGYVNLYRHTGNKTYLAEAEAVAKGLLKTSIPGYAGHCWGYPFDWMTTRGLWTSGIPLMTTTVYCFEAYLALYDATQNQHYLDIAYSIFLFTLHDIKDVSLEQDVAVCSYSPVDNSQIVNANAYRSFVLVEGAKRFQHNEALQMAQRNLNFVVKAQQQDGSWPYAVNEPHDNFVDNFHTCFVLKNLIKVNVYLKEERIANAIRKGFQFYKQHLLAEDFTPKPFAKLSRFNVVKTELYDYAESISLCLQLQHTDAEAKKIAAKLADDVVSRFQQKNGCFYTRLSRFGLPNKIPYLRWAQSQLFYALSNCLNQNQ